jgi:hypothetical protein
LTDFAPFGATGIVIGIKPESLEILFDEEFIGGNDLNGRCSPLRGGEVK